MKVKILHNENKMKAMIPKNVILIRISLIALICIFTLTGFNSIPNELQECEIDIPENKTWTGQANWSASRNIKNSVITIQKINGTTFQISDYSGGMIAANGHSNDNAMTISLDCNNQVQSKTFTTPFGNCVVSGGSWDSSTGELKIEWNIAPSGVYETTTFTLNQ